MPYIRLEDRKKFKGLIDNMPLLENKGELEYLIFRLMQHYMMNKERRYSTLHDCVYAAMHCADEYRRRYLDLREDAAIIENGDIEE